MDGQEIQFNQNLYNVFAICQDFRQRLMQLQRLNDADTPTVPEDLD